jgi:hypothetical protein
VLLALPRDEHLMPVDALHHIEIGGLGRSVTAGTTLGEVRLRVSNAITGQPVEDRYLFHAPILAPDAAVVTVGEDALPDGWSLAGSDLRIPSGTHEIRSNLAIPTGLRVRIEAGAVLALGPGVSILSRSPVTAEGTAARPVEIRRLDPERPWGSFGVVDAGGRSSLRHVRVRGGSQGMLRGVRMTGQLAFHASDVDLSDCEIREAGADDALNVKHASVEVERCRFVSNPSDGFDGDWITGTVRDSVFLDDGGDGLDLSGSDVRVVDCLFGRMGDKGISAGEKSRVVVFNDVIRDSAIGIAIKDLSRVEVAASVFYQNDTAVSAYRKKPHFGGGTGAITSSLFWRNDEDVATDPESAVTLATVAMEARPGAGGVEHRDLRTGDLDAAWRTDGATGFALRETDAASDFARGANPESPLPDGVGAPDLAAGPIGLVRPLARP